MADMKDFTEIKLFDTSIHHYQIFLHHVWIWRERWMKERGGNKDFFQLFGRRKWNERK
jgi:hypothetical protein